MSSVLRQLDIEFVNSQEKDKEIIPNLLIQNRKLVILFEKLSLVDGKRTIELDIKIEADFEDIPKKYHEYFLSMITTKYYSKLYFNDTNFQTDMQIPKKPWYNFLKFKI